MSVWEVLANAVDFFVWSLLAVLLAILGRVTKLFHEEARGNERVTFRVFLRNLPDALVVGIIATSLTYTAAEYLKVPIYAGVGLGGALGYLGLQTLVPILINAVQRLYKKKPTDAPPDA
jgi:hypothetical protein